MKRYILMGLFCILCTTSCLYKDLGNYDYNRLPNIKIDSIPKTINSIKILVDVVTIEPVVTYGDVENDKDFEFTWYSIIDDKLNVISHEKVFKDVLRSEGANAMRFQVTHKPTGLSTYRDMICNVNSMTEQGWYLLKETADGNTDMDGFFKDTDGASIEIRNIVTTVLGAPLTGLPISLDYSHLRWVNPSNDELLVRKAMFAMSQEDIAAFDVVNLKSLTTFEGLFVDAMPAKGERKLEMLQSTKGTQLLIYNGGKFRTRITKGGSQFLFEYDGDDNLAPHTIGDLENTMPVYNRTTSSISTVSSSVSKLSLSVDYNSGKPSPYFRSDKANNLDSDLIFFSKSNANIPTRGGGGSGFALLTDKSNPDSSYLCHLVVGDRISMINACSIVAEIDTLAQGSLIPKGTHFATNLNGATFYFSTVDNKVHTLYKGLMTPTTTGETLNALDFEDEEITWMSFMSVGSVNGLIIATYKDGNYKLREYAIQSNGMPELEPKMTLEGKGKIRGAKYILAK